MTTHVRSCLYKDDYFFNIHMM